MTKLFHGEQDTTRCLQS